MDIEIKLPWRPMTETPRDGSEVVCMYYLRMGRDKNVVFHQNRITVNKHNWADACDLEIVGGVVQGNCYFMWAYQDELYLHQVLQMRKELPIPAPKTLWHIMPDNPFDDRKEGTEVKITFLNQIMVRGTSEVQSTYFNHAVVSNSAAWQAVKFANKYAMRWAYSEDVVDALFDLLRKQERWV